MVKPTTQHKTYTQEHVKQKRWPHWGATQATTAQDEKQHMQAPEAPGPFPRWPGPAVTSWRPCALCGFSPTPPGCMRPTAQLRSDIS